MTENIRKTILKWIFIGGGLPWLITYMFLNVYYNYIMFEGYQLILQEPRKIIIIIELIGCIWAIPSFFYLFYDLIKEKIRKLRIE